MSERIEVGDLVMVVRPSLCCGYDKNVGKVFVVDNIYSGPTAPCPTCGGFVGNTLIRRAGRHNGFEPPRLKRIPPLSEPERAAERGGVKA